MAENELRSPTADFPTYDKAKHFVRLLDGTPYSLFRRMNETLWEQRGSPQAQVDWANPDTWITERLQGEERQLAWKIWRESNRTLNPRHLSGVWNLSVKHHLLERDLSDCLHLTDKGHRFLTHEETLIAQIDEYEGNLTLLQIVAERGPGKRRDFLQDYAAYCLSFTTYRKESVIKDALYYRLINLVERGFVTRNAQVYEITDAGIQYLDKHQRQIHGRTIADNQSELLKLVRGMNKEARELLSNHLLAMNPFKFEALIKFLLEEMGYNNVELTSPTNDKGVDVVADIELGISRVREVVQVKRYKGNVGREVLDMLRGSLHRFQAVRGTIITTGGFAKGTERAAFEVGAAPITLIDGDKLLDLLIEYEIGVTKKSVEYLEFDASKLIQFDTDENNEAE